MFTKQDKQGIIKIKNGDGNMPYFIYKAVDRDGNTKEGKLSADSEEKLLDKLREYSLTVIDVRETSEDETGEEEDILTKDVGFSFEFGIPPKAITFFARQLSITLNAGLPITRILTTLYKQTSSKKLRQIIYEIGKDVQTGESLSAAFAKQRNVFDGLFISMITVGEASGTLPKSVAKLADLMEKDQAIRRRVSAALSYPVFVIIFSCILSYVLVALLMPGFIHVFKSSGIDVDNDYPLTAMLIKLSGFITDPIVVSITFAAIALLLLAIHFLGKNEKGRYYIDYIKLNFPFLNSVTKTSAVVRFCRSLATLMKSGVPILKSLSLVADSSGNAVISKNLENMAKSIQEGERISRVMKNTRLFPELVLQMVSIGEETGDISEMLDKTADYFEQEMESSIESLTSLLEPVMMIFVGGMVGLFVMGIILPIMGMVSKVGG